MRDAIGAVDTLLLRGVLELPHPDWLNAVMRGFSVVGVGGAIWVALAAVLLVARAIHWRDAARVVIAVALVHLVVDVALKPWIDRQRPPLGISGPVPFAETPPSRSFPSGHAANAMAAALVLTRAWRRGRAWVWTAAGIMAIARVYLGIHYPLDAAAGCVIGLACGWAVLVVPGVSAVRGAR
jgi:undecaprenyl-diphosphatase